MYVMNLQARRSKFLAKYPHRPCKVGELSYLCYSCCTKFKLSSLHFKHKNILALTSTLLLTFWKPRDKVLVTDFELPVYNRQCPC